MQLSAQRDSCCHFFFFFVLPASVAAHPYLDAFAPPLSAFVLWLSFSSVRGCERRWLSVVRGSERLVVAARCQCHPTPTALIPLVWTFLEDVSLNQRPMLVCRLVETKMPQSLTQHRQARRVS